jgi:hypothetical protein
VVCEGVHDLSVEQVRGYTSYRFSSIITYSIAEVGEHLHGFHHRVF